MKFRLLVLAGLLVVAIPAFGWWSETSRAGQTQPAPIAAAGQAATEPQPAASPPTPAPTSAPGDSVAVALISAPAVTAPPSSIAAAQASEPAAAGPAPIFEPAGCQAPPADYTRLNVRGW